MRSKMRSSKTVGRLRLTLFASNLKNIVFTPTLRLNVRIAAERGGEKIVVEIKSFLSRSSVSDFETALGQYSLYRRLLSQTAPDAKLFLAVSEATYTDFFVLKATQFIIEAEEISLFTVNLESEEIERWIKH